MRPVCSYCDRPAMLVTGALIYPHRTDLHRRHFWNCAACQAYVGCHERGAYIDTPSGRVTSDGTLPLGRLANAELRRWKTRAHAAFDPVWKARSMTRRQAYAWLAGQLGISVDNCHIGMFDVDGCRAVVAAVQAWRVTA